MVKGYCLKEVFALCAFRRVNKRNRGAGRLQSGRRSCVALLLLYGLAAGAISGQGEVRRRPESTPADVNLTIRTRGGQSVFHIGETIELELSFTSTAPRKYVVDASTFYDRRFSPDRIAVTPLSGWDDPLADFYRLCSVFFEGGLVNTNGSSAEPTVVNLELNEWIRFNNPGEYQISVQSQRPRTRTPKRLLTLNSNRLS